MLPVPLANNLKSLFTLVVIELSVIKMLPVVKTSLSIVVNVETLSKNEVPNTFRSFVISRLLF